MAKITKKTTLSTVIAFLCVIELFSVLPPRKPELKTERVPNSPVLKGIIHVHSTYSDGGGTVEDIVRATEGTDTDFLILTDHMDSRARKEGFEKRYGDLDLFVEMEASTMAGHLTSFYSHTDARNLPDREMNELAWQHFLGNASRKDLFVALSHPTNIKNPWGRMDRAPEGIEIVNFDSSWQRQVSESVLGFFTTLITCPFNPYLATLRFFQLHQKDLTIWDGMNSLSPGHFGILAHDTHAKLKLNNEKSLKWPSYEQTFRLASNAIYLNEPLMSDFEARKAQIYNAIRGGQIAVVYDAIYPRLNSEFWIQCNSTKVTLGKRHPFEQNCEARVQIPATFPYRAIVKLYRNGELIEEKIPTNGLAYIPLSQNGIYRVEVWAKTRSLFRVLLRQDSPYLLFNPIYLQ